MNKLQLLKIALLIYILAVNIKRAEKLNCDICGEKFRRTQLLYGDDYKICGLCSDIQSELSSMY